MRQRHIARLAGCDRKRKPDQRCCHCLQAVCFSIKSANANLPRPRNPVIEPVERRHALIGRRFNRRHRRRLCSTACNVCVGNTIAYYFWLRLACNRFVRRRSFAAFANAVQQRAETMFFQKWAQRPFWDWLQRHIFQRNRQRAIFF